MTAYKAFYNAFEENNDLHQTTQKVEDAENRLADLYKGLDSDTVEKIDDLFGVIVRAYKIQGFEFALSLKDKALI